jgi:putative transposase
VRAHQAAYPIATMCRVLGLSTSGYYAWNKRVPSARTRSNARLVEQIRTIHECSGGTYGAPRVHAQLSEQGVPAGYNRVARLMRQAQLRGVSRRRWVCTTQRDRRARPAADLVQRRFSAELPDQLWVADITYIATWEGFLYLAVVLDVFSRKVVGWAMRSHLLSELVLSALDMAFTVRRPHDVIHHSDQGRQYTSVAFGARCEALGVRASMGSVGDCYDNAMCESFFATLECELLERYRFRTKAEAEAAVFQFIEGWYNPHRLHSSLGYVSPVNYERAYHQNAASRA